MHLVNGRYWQTTCSHYSGTVVRCTTNIYAAKVIHEGNAWYKQNTWVFNNLSYLPSPREQWAGNPLATTGSWTSADRHKWRSECDTAATGRGACRDYILAAGRFREGRRRDPEVDGDLQLGRALLHRKRQARHLDPGRRPRPLRRAGPRPEGAAHPGRGKAGPREARACPGQARAVEALVGRRLRLQLPLGLPPVKGNADSGIYHVRGQRYYNATKPEECFATEQAARDAGYRKAKV